MVVDLLQKLKDELAEAKRREAAETWTETTMQPGVGAGPPMPGPPSAPPSPPPPTLGQPEQRLQPAPTPREELRQAQELIGPRTAALHERLGQATQLAGKVPAMLTRIDFERKREEALRSPVVGRMPEQEKLIAAQTPAEYEEFQETPSIGAGVMRALETADKPRQLIKEHVIEPTMGAVPGPVDMLKKAGLPDEIATPLGALIAGPAAPAEVVPENVQAEVASIVLDPINVAFFPGKTIKAIRAVVEASPKLAAAVRAAGESPAVRRAGIALREAAIGRKGEAGFIGGRDIVGADIESRLAREARGKARAWQKEYEDSIARATRRPAPTPETGPAAGRDLPGEELERSFGRQPILGVLSDFTPSRRIPKWLEDPVGKVLENFTRPAELALPAPLLPLGRVQRRLPHLLDYFEQITKRNLRFTEARQRLAGVRDAYKSQAPRRRVVTRARKAGLEEPPAEPLHSRNEIATAQKQVREARREYKASLEALKEADVRRVGGDIVEEALALGAPEETAATLRLFFENAGRYYQMDEPFMNLPPWRKRIDQLIARGQGNVPGTIGEVGQDMMALNAALEETRRPFVQLLDDMQTLIEKELPGLEFTGKEAYAGLADKYGAYYLVTHPEDFRGISTQLQGLLDEAQEMSGARYALLKAIDPKAAPEVAGRYLPQLWDDGIDWMERVRRPWGRPFIEKPRAIKDWRGPASSGSWPSELADMSPAELLDYATRAADHAMADRAFRKVVLDMYGTRMKPKAGRGLVRFRNPVFAGWYGPPDAAWMVDAIYEPGPQWTRMAGGAMGAVKNTAFGPDASIAGYNLLQALSVGSGHALLGAFNRMLRTISLGAEYWGQRGLTRRAAFAVDGLAIPGAEAPFQARQGTLLQYIPAFGRLDPALTASLDKWTHFQYGTIMGNLRDLVAEGGLLLAKTTGRDLKDPAVRRSIMDAANALTGTSRGALRVGRREIEAQAFASSRITRSLFSMVGTAANTVRPGATATERILGASVVANMGFTISAVGWAINKYWGNGEPYNPLPFEWTDGELKRNRNWATVTIGERRYNLIPQKSLMTLMWKSMESLVGLDPDALGRAVSQFGYSRLHPAVQPVPLMAGFGFVPHSGFWAGAMPTEQRLKGAGMTGLPVLAQVALRGEEQGFQGFIEEAFGLNSYELSTQDKKKSFLRDIDDTLTDDERYAIEQGVVPQRIRNMPEWQVLENESLQDMLNNPRTHDYAEDKETRDQTIAAAGQKYLEDGDGFAYSRTVSAARSRFVIQIEDMDFEDKGVISEYAAATYGNPKALDPLTGVLDPDRLDPLRSAWEATASPEDYRVVREWARVSNDPVEAEARRDRQRIHDTGYDGIPQDVWERVRKPLLGDAGQAYADLYAYEDYVRRETLKVIPETLPPGLRIGLAELLTQQNPVIKSTKKVITTVRRGMLDSTPWLLDLLLKWGRKPPGKHDIAVLTGTAE